MAQLVDAQSHAATEINRDHGERSRSVHSKRPFRTASKKKIGGKYLEDFGDPLWLPALVLGARARLQDQLEKS